MSEEPQNGAARGVNDDYIRAIARSEAKVEALTESMRDLKRAVEELIDRVDADIDTLRAKWENFAVVASGVDDLKRRMTIVETKLEGLVVDQTKTETELRSTATELKNAVVERTRLETKLEAIQARLMVISGGIGVIVWIAGRLFK